MNNTKSFNIFSILGKDDKELIHSAFLKFLLEEKKESFCKYFDIDLPPIKKFHLEKRHQVPEAKGAKRKYIRTDIEGVRFDNLPVLVLENKFKSFPYKIQLENYNQVYNKFSGSSILKILFCFDPLLIPFRQEFESEWKFFGYKTLVDFLEEIIVEEKDSEKKLFIRHYRNFLFDVYTDYEGKLDNLKVILNKPKENKFWLQLMNSTLLLRLLERPDMQPFDYHLNPGNTTIPVLNIIPKAWAGTNHEFLVQLQGSELKFYMHYLNDWKIPAKGKDKNFGDLLKKERRKFLSEFLHEISSSKNFKYKGCYKTLGKKEFNSCFLFKTDLNIVFQEKENISLKDLEVTFLEFLHVGHQIVENYITTLNEKV